MISKDELRRQRRQMRRRIQQVLTERRLSQLERAVQEEPAEKAA